MKCTKQLAKGVASETGEPTLEALIYDLIRQLESPERVIELYYWSREPHLLEIVRALVMMRPHIRAMLGAFFSIANDPQIVGASIDAMGRLILESPNVAPSLDAITRAAEGVAPDELSEPDSSLH